MKDEPSFQWRCYQLWKRGLNTEQIARALSAEDSNADIKRVYAEYTVYSALSKAREIMTKQRLEWSRA